MKRLIAIIAVIIMVAGFADFTQTANAQGRKGMEMQRARKKQPAQNSTQKSTGTNNKNTQKSASKTTGQKNNVVSAATAEVQKQQQQAQQEVKQTEQQIRENEAQVKKSLNELGKLDQEIEATNKTISSLNTKINKLKSNISSLEKGINKNEKELKKLREEYLKAVKKMRVKGKNQSTLAFLFSSKSFSQAFRRMRYLKEFSAWRNRQTEEITAKITDLKNQKEALAKAQQEESAALALQKTTQNKLADQHSKEEVLIADLKKNGEVLQVHLRKKQEEATALKNKVSQLIAVEQRKAAEEQRRAEEAARKAAEAEARRKAEEAERQRQKELLARQEAERARQEAERARQEAERAKQQAAQKQDQKQGDVNTTPLAQATPKKEEPKKQTQPKPQPQPEPKKQTVERPKETAPKNDNSPTAYADARKRTPRSQNNSGNQKSNTSSGNNKSGGSSQTLASNNAAPATPKASGGSFQDMRGKLPSPSTGSFTITSRFGRQHLPDLPDVEYDNPGIDAETEAGSSARAVYKGKVSGVYLLPGYNTVVIINHGNYYTVYGNIASPSVKTGDTVEAGTSLGKLAPSEDDSRHSSIHFEVWKNREKLNPQDWLR